MQTGEIFDIKKYAIHDGPGIRTTVFFKGCPLSCGWCHNPESIKKETQRLYRADRCIGCKECIQACPHDALQDVSDKLKWSPADCRYCQTCARVCPTEAVAFVGKTMTVEAVMAEITRDTLFYDQSRGGVTVSGGEPFMQPSFLMELLDACGALELHRTVDTSGHVDTETLLNAVARTELFLYDLKHMDAEKHLAYTGVSNQKILSNLKQLSRHGADIIIRLPLIPGVNCDDENIDRTGAFVSTLPGVRRVNLLPYHGAAATKYQHLGLNSPSTRFERPCADRLASIVTRLSDFNLDVKIGG